MAKKLSNLGQPWTSTDVQKLRALARGNTPTGLIAYKMQRTTDAVRGKASEKDISLKPTNKSPFNRIKKG